MARGVLILGSLVGHAGLLAALGYIEVDKAEAATAIEVFEAKEKPKPPPPPAELEPPPPEPKAPPRARADNPKPAEAPPETPAPTSNTPALDALPDFGLDLGGSGGPGGWSMAQGTGSPNAKPTPRPVQKSLEPVAARAPAIDPCEEGPAKPKLKNLPQPAYTDQARAAGIEGKVRVQITVDEAGRVVEAKVLSSLGHGLDEAALTAAKAASFDAAVRCGKPARSTFTIAMRFTAS